jgi:hypothetical protein
MPAPPPSAIASAAASRCLPRHAAAHATPRVYAASAATRDSIRECARSAIADDGTLAQMRRADAAPRHKRRAWRAAFRRLRLRRHFLSPLLPLLARHFRRATLSSIFFAPLSLFFDIALFDSFLRCHFRHYI